MNDRHLDNRSLDLDSSGPGNIEVQRAIGLQNECKFQFRIG